MVIYLVALKNVLIYLVNTVRNKKFSYRSFSGIAQERIGSVLRQDTKDFCGREIQTVTGAHKEQIEDGSEQFQRRHAQKAVHLFIYEHQKQQ